MRDFDKHELLKFRRAWPWVYGFNASKVCLKQPRSRPWATLHRWRCGTGRDRLRSHLMPVCSIPPTAPFGASLTRRAGRHGRHLRRGLDGRRKRALEAAG